MGDGDCVRGQDQEMNQGDPRVLDEFALHALYQKIWMKCGDGVYEKIKAHIEAVGGGAEK